MLKIPDKVRKIKSKKVVLNRGKRQRVTVDENVELSSRAIKLVTYLKIFLLLHVCLILCCHVYYTGTFSAATNLSRSSTSTTNWQLSYTLTIISELSVITLQVLKLLPTCINMVNIN